MKNYWLNSQSALIALTVLLSYHLGLAQTFVYTGGVQNYTVPASVTVINVTVSGGSGGGSAGLGAMYSSTLAVTPGQVLQLYVGGQGGTGAGAAGGFNGGGQAGGSFGNEGAGGGASDIRISPYGLANRLIVAGGGGGGGGWAGGAGGGGGLVGLSGGAGQAGGGGGGTASSGGTPGFGNGGCGSGAFGNLGTGGAGNFCSYGGGGAGGGYYGGGGGGGDNNSCCADGGGGGGGSSFCVSAGAVCTDAVNSGNGVIIICTSLLPSNTTSISNLTRCAGQTTTLTATGGGPIFWFANPSGGAALASGASFITPTLSALGATYYIESSTCTGPASRVPVTITVNPSPTISVNSGGICQGQSFTMVPSGATSYTFQGGSSVVSPGSNTSYTVSGTNSLGCVSVLSATANVVINPNPTITVNSGTLCTTGSFTIVPSGGVSYSISGGTFIVSPLTNTTYIITGNNSFGCTNTAVSSITAIASPVISVNSGSICSGQSFTLVPSGAATYTFQGGSSVVNPLATSVYTVIGTSVAGCVSPAFASSNVTVNPIPVISVNSGSICSGSIFTISPSGASTYTISGGSAIVSPSVNAVYYISGTSAQGCAASNTAISTVTVYVTPIITVNSSAICLGQSFTMSPSGASSYTFSNGTAVVNPISTSSYSVTGTSNQGCVSSAPAISTVTVYANPTISVNSGTLCQGQSFTIVPSGAVNYTISGGANIVSPLATTSYTINGASAQGCYSSNNPVSNVVVNPNPTIAVNSGSVCLGQPFTITPSGAATYTFSSGSAVVSPSNNAIYYITGTSAAGCAGANTAICNITVNSLPLVTVNNGVICNGQSFTMSPSGAISYTFSSGNAVVSPSANSSYTVIGSDSFGCVSTNAVSHVTVMALPGVSALSTNSTICSGENVTLTATGAISYVWTNIASLASIVVSPTTTTTYTVTGTGVNGCTNTFSLTQTVNVCAGLSSNTAEQSVTIFPNPSQGEFIIAAQSDMNISLINEMGQLVKVISLNDNNGHEVFVNELASGIYFVVGTSNNQTIKQKVIIEK